MLARFIGADGSMGLIHGNTYNIKVLAMSSNYAINLEIDTSLHNRGRIYCPYDSLEALIKNWQLPTAEQLNPKIFKKLFPILGTPFAIDWEVIAPHEDQAKKNHGQSLQRLAERGGLDYSELLAVLNDSEFCKPYNSHNNESHERRIREMTTVYDRRKL